jgi:uncharacterized phosphatase
MGRLILVRHGESAGNRDRMFAAEPHSLVLTERGYAQAAAVARLIGTRFAPELVVASPYVRAHETGRVIAAHLGLPLEIEAQLFEREVGEFRGRPYETLHAARDEDLQLRYSWRPKDGESYEDVIARVGPVLDRLARKHLDRDVVVVSHGAVMVALWSHVAGSWEGAYVAPNCGVVLVEHDADGYRAPQVFGGAAAADTGG